MMYKPIRDRNNFSGVCSFSTARQHYDTVEGIAHADQTMRKSSECLSVIQSVEDGKLNVNTILSASLKINCIVILYSIDLNF